VLLRGAGLVLSLMLTLCHRTGTACEQDATRLFNKYHSWVNPDFMLKRCFLGMVNASDDVERVGEDASDSESDSDTDDEERSSDLFGNNMTTNPGNRDEMDEDVDALYIAELQE